jgi:hypothetical protein
MVLLRVGAGGAWKLQPGELESFKKGSLEAPISKGECWNFRCDLVGNLRPIGLGGPLVEFSPSTS